MTKFLVFGGKRLTVPLATCDTKEAADLYKERGDAWHGPDHPLTPLTVVELQSKGEIGEHAYVVSLSLRHGYQTIWHAIVGDSDEAAVLAEKIATPAFAGKVDKVRHNQKPFPVFPR